MKHNARLHALLGQLGWNNAEAKPGLAFAFSKGRTERTSELTDAEGYELCAHLQAKLDEKNGTSTTHSPKPADKAQRLRMRLISKFREMGYEQHTTGKPKADMARINAMLVSKWGKEINGYKQDELQAMLGVVERTWLPHFYKQKNG